MNTWTSNTPVEIRKPVNLYRERVRAGVAASAKDHTALVHLLERIAPQVDEIFVYLFETTSLDKRWMPSGHNIRFFTGPDVGSLARFTFINDFIGYYIPLEVHTKYDRYHVSQTISAIEAYNRRAVVGWAKSLPSSTDPALPSTAPRNVIENPSLTTNKHIGKLDYNKLGFHTDTFRFDFREAMQNLSFEIPFIQQLQSQNAELIILDTGTLNTPADDNRSQLPDVSSVTGKQGSTRVNQKAVASGCKDATLLPTNRAKKVSIIGRANRTRWKKGGILKSVLLTEEMLSAHGCSVELVDIEEGKVFNLDAPDVVIIYVGDPERPDFKRVHKIVEYHANKGIPTLVNLSEDHFPRRTTEIQRVMSVWHKRYNGLVSMMTFSHNVDSRPEYSAFNSSIVPLPKTLTFSHQKYAEYATTSGIFIGDVAKLSDPRIVGPEAPDRLRLLRSAIPEAKIYGLQQYKSKYEIPDGIDEVWPFMPSADLAARLTHLRLMISFPRYATYEMVPIESAALGVPLLYPDMPQSLNEAVGFAGYRYRDTFDLINSAQLIYRDPLVWKQFSRSGIRRARSQDFDVTSAKIYLAIKNFVERHNQRKIWS